MRNVFKIAFFLILIPLFGATEKFDKIDAQGLKLQSGQLVTTISTDTTLTSSNATNAQLPSYLAIIKNVETLISGLSSTYQAIITGAASTITSSDLTANRIAISNSSGKIGVSSATDTEAGYLSGVTSGIQSQLNSKQATITGAISGLVSSDLATQMALRTNELGKIVVSTVTDTELTYLSGVTSGVQSQINAKQATITGAATTIASSDLTANRTLISNASGKIDVSSITDTKLGYLSNVTSDIQNQINNISVSVFTDTQNGTVPAPNNGATGTTVLYDNGIWAEPPGSEGGEANTASNTGSLGTGIFKTKTGVDLAFYKLYSSSAPLTIALSGTDYMDFSLNTANTSGGLVTRSANNTISADYITEITSDSGVTIDSLKIKDAGLAVNSLPVGTGIDTDITLQWSNGDANKSGLRYNSATNKNQYSNDGITWTDMGTGGTGSSDGTPSEFYATGFIADTTATNALYTKGSGDPVEITNITLNNTNSTQEIVNLYVVPNNGGAVGTAGVTNKFLSISIAANSSAMVDFAKCGLILNDEYDSIQAESTTTNKTTISINGYTGSTKLRLAEIQYLANTLTSVFAAPSGGCTIKTIILYNNNTTSETVTLDIVPNGQSASSTYRLAYLSIAASSTVFLEFEGAGIVMPTEGDFLSGSTTTANKVNIAVFGGTL